MQTESLQHFASGFLNLTNSTLQQTKEYFRPLYNEAMNSEYGLYAKKIAVDYEEYIDPLLKIGSLLQTFGGLYLTTVSVVDLAVKPGLGSKLLSVSKLITGIALYSEPFLNDERDPSELTANMLSGLTGVCVASVRKIIIPLS